MDSSPTSEPDQLATLRRAVRGGGGTSGLAAVLPLLQIGHRRELRTEPHWAKEELVRHPEPRELIRSMRKAGNLDDQGRPTYTLDERRSLTANVYENRVVRQVVDDVRDRLTAIDAAGNADARTLLRELEGARRQAPFLDEIPAATRTEMPTATLTGDPLYRSVMHVRAMLRP
jgi:hypothetical protein